MPVLIPYWLWLGLLCSLPYASKGEFTNECELKFVNGEKEGLISSSIRQCIEQAKRSGLYLELYNFSLPALSSGYFSDLGFVSQLVVTVNDSRLPLLFPSSLPESSRIFHNSSFDKVQLSAVDVPTLAGWRWRLLRNATVRSLRGFVFYAFRSKLVYLHPDFGIVAGGRVTQVRIVKCGLRWLGEGVFAPLDRLQVVELGYNLLTDIRRSHLPVDARELKVLDLRNNLLTHLDNDLLNGLNLQKFSVVGNNFKTIDQSVLHTVLNMEKLSAIEGIKWPCTQENRTLSEFKRYQKLMAAKQVKCY